MLVNIKKTMEPKVYGLLIEFGETIFLSIQYAYSLEDAYLMAKLEFNKQNPHKLLVGNSLLGAKIGLFAIKTLKELTTTPKLAQIKEEDKAKEIAKIFGSFEEIVKKENSVIIPNPEKTNEEMQESIVEKNKIIKNKIMSEIIKNKDKELFGRMRNMLTKAEQQYIEEHIK